MAKKYQRSRAWRNNNPLNIRKGEKWQGLCAQQTDSEFCQFMNMTFGYRAAAKCLRSYDRYFRQMGHEWNIANIISRWAPQSENNTDDYIQRVTQLMGRDSDHLRLPPLDTTPGRVQLGMLMAAMTCVESGCPPEAVPVENLNAGMLLAGLGHIGLEEKWW